jgi:hypothetical protein
MKVSARAYPAALAIVTVLPIGLVSCTPAATPLKCTASVSAARPVQNTRETITVKTVAGAQVITSARYKTNTANVTTLSNAHGVASTVYNVGAALTSFKVNVTATVVKGIQHATCATSFIPAAPPKVPSSPAPPVQPAPIPAPVPAPVINLDNVSWRVNPNGNALPYIPQLPSAVCFSQFHQSNITGAEACGQLVIGLAVTGIEPYNVPITAQIPGNMPMGFSSFTGYVSLTWTLTCSIDNAKTYGTSKSGLGGTYAGDLGYGPNRVTSDESDVSLYANVDFGHGLDNCYGPSIVTSLAATDIHVSIDHPALPKAAAIFTGSWSS